MHMYTVYRTSKHLKTSWTLAKIPNVLKQMPCIGRQHFKFPKPVGWLLPPSESPVVSTESLVLQMTFKLCRLHFQLTMLAMGLSTYL